MPGPFNGGGKMGRNSTQTGAGGPNGTGGASRGGTSGGSKATKDKLKGTLFDFSNPTLNVFDKRLKEIPDITKGKITEGGGKPGEDNIAKSQALITNKPLTDVEKAVIEARRQRAALAPGVTAAQTLLGAMPAPGLAAGFGLGNWMGKKTEDDAAAHPENYRTDLNDPGSLFSKSGPVSTNRAIDLPSNRSNLTNAGGDNDEVKKKNKRPLPTLLGAPASPLGTPNNPIVIS